MVTRAEITVAELMTIIRGGQKVIMTDERRVMVYAGMVSDIPEILQYRKVELITGSDESGTILINIIS